MFLFKYEHKGTQLQIQMYVYYYVNTLRYAESSKLALTEPLVKSIVQ